LLEDESGSFSSVQRLFLSISCLLLCTPLLRRERRGGGGVRFRLIVSNSYFKFKIF